MMMCVRAQHGWRLGTFVLSSIAMWMEVGPKSGWVANLYANQIEIKKKLQHDENREQS